MNLSFVLDIQNAQFGTEDNVVLSNVNFSLAQGEMCYIIGPSGSGKSTFLKTLYASIPLMSGTVNMVDQDLGTLTRKSIPYYRRKVGMVFQEFHLFYNWSVQRNLDYILKATEWKHADERKNRVDEVLSEVGLIKSIDKPAFKLSGGEQQRLVIARSILNKPRIIIADEPTGNLDPKSSEAIIELLYRVAQENKMAILIATHDYHLIEKYQARIFECNDGRLLEKH